VRQVGATCSEKLPQDRRSFSHHTPLNTLSLCWELVHVVFHMYSDLDLDRENSRSHRIVQWCMVGVAAVGYDPMQAL
jgi:hypothetical protein